MALSGSKTVSFCSRNGSNRYYLKWNWIATQSDANNTSTVTVKLYIGSYGNGYGINSSAKKSGSITIDGTEYSFTNTCGISSGGSKLLATKSKTITHNSDGTKTFSISAAFNPNVSISGTMQGNVPMPSTSYTLNRIARASSFSSTAGWKFPNNKTISINRKSSSFRHTVRIYIAGNTSPLKTWTKTSSTSFSTSFTDEENKKILQAINSNDKNNISVKMQLDTYSGDAQIGSTAEISGTISYYGRSSTTFTNSLNIGGTISGKITENHKDYRHSVDIMQSNGTTVIANAITHTNDTLSWSVTPTASTVYALTPNSNTYTAKIRLRTFYKTTGVQVGNDNIANITFKVTNSNPTFAPTLAYTDTNTTTSTLMGESSLVLVQNKSKLQVTVTGNATAENSATMKEIHCIIAGNTYKQSYSSSATAYTFNIGVVDSSSNQVATIQAVDSRGNKTSKSITVKFVPYTAPKFGAIVARANQFSTTVNVSGKGSFSPLPVGDSNKNGIKAMSYAYRVDNATSNTGTGSLTATVSGSNYTANTANFTLSETSIATVTVTVRDKLDTVVSVAVEVPTGKPLMFIDSNKGNISFNALPDMTQSSLMTIGNKVDLARNQYFGNGNASYGLNAMNSDIVGVNSIVFNDVSNNLGEGLRFPKSTYTIPENNHLTSANIPSNDDFNTFYIRDNAIYLDNTQVLKFNNHTSWENCDYHFQGRSLVFQCNYDVGWNDSTMEGFVVRDNAGNSLRFDVNEILSLDADNQYKDLYLHGSHIGINCTEGMRLQFVTDVDPTSNNYSGLTLEQMKYDSSTRTLTTTGNVMRIDANEVMAINDDDNIYTNLALHGRTSYLVGHQAGDPATANELKVGYDSNANPAFVASASIYNRTGTTTANMFVTSAGTLYRSTSSAKYKLDIVPAFNSIDEYKKILDIEPVKWFDKNAIETNAEAMTAEYNGEEYEVNEIPNMNRVYGCVAEQLEDVGLDCLVTYDDENNDVTGVAYDRIPIMYIPLFKDLYNQVEQLQQEIKTLKGEN